MLPNVLYLSEMLSEKADGKKAMVMFMVSLLK